LSRLATAPSEPSARAAPTPIRATRVVTAFALAGAAALVLAAVHVTQGTSTIDAFDLVGLVFGSGDQDAARVLVASRLPRLLAGVLVGLALGVAGAAMQSLARNSLASPDTLAVNDGAYLAIVAAASFGLALPVLPAGALAFLGGLAGAALVLALGAGSRSGPMRLILAGSAIALALGEVTTLLMLLFPQATIGLYAWGSGTLVQSDLDAVTRMAPVVAVAVVALVGLGRRLDILGLGDDTATVLGLAVRRTRLAVIVLTVLLGAASVTVVGPIGFVGLCAPVLVRLVAPLVPGLGRHRVLLPMAGVVGVLIVLGADVLLRGAFGARWGVEIPTGVVTTVLGAAVLIWLARRHRDSGPTRQPPPGRAAPLRSRRFVTVVATVGVVALIGCGLAGMLLGDTMLLAGDLVNWTQGRTGPAYTFVIDQRYPRVVAALLAGAALAIAGTTIQAVSRNPLAEPGILGMTSGAGVGAVALITMVPLAPVWLMSTVAGAGAMLAFAIVYGLSWRGGFSSDRLILMGVGVSAGFGAVITLIIVATDPWNTGKALTWLSGSTYGRTPEQLLPVLVALVALTPVVLVARRDLDLLALDEDIPRVLGVRLSRVRLVALVGAATLTATAVVAVGVVGFVGLIAPHAARILVGGRHARVVPVAALLGAVLVSVADTVGRTVIAPAQLPAGLVTSLIGAPYFVWLLYRTSRPTSAH
jgi:ferric hydroxamate transport system permease protein